MKRTFSLILLLVFAAQTFCNAIIVFDFYLNQSYIARVRCENRNRPMLNCKGKCQLAKKLKEEENRNTSNPERKFASKNEWVAERPSLGLASATAIISSTTFLDFLPAKPIDRSIPVFHPPGI